MNEVEVERVVAALQAMTGGLIVTEQDTLESRAHLRSRLTPPSPRRRTAAVLVAAAALIVAAVVVGLILRAGDDDVVPEPAHPPTPAERLVDALQPEAYLQSDADFFAGPAPTAADLAGLWLLRNDSTDPDNVPMVVDRRGFWRAGVLTYPYYWGSSTLAGDTWTRHVDGRSQCARSAGLGDYSQEWTTAIAADGSVHTRLAAGSDVCTPLEGEEVWDRVAPGSPVAEYLRAAAEDLRWQEAAVHSAPDGVYVAPATGYLLEVDTNGGFRYFRSLTDAELAAADRGRLDPEAAEGAISGTCRGGRFSGRLETAVVPGVQGYLSPNPALRITPSADSCSSDLTDQGVWVQLFSGQAEHPVVED